MSNAQHPQSSDRKFQLETVESYRMRKGILIVLFGWGASSTLAAAIISLLSLFTDKVKSTFLAIPNNPTGSVFIMFVATGVILMITLLYIIAYIQAPERISEINEQRSQTRGTDHVTTAS